MGRDSDDGPVLQLFSLSVHVQGDVQGSRARRTVPRQTWRGKLSVEDIEWELILSRPYFMSPIGFPLPRAQLV